MKKLFGLLLTAFIVVWATVAFSQNASAPTTNVTFMGLNLSQDNLLLAEKGQKGFVAAGGGYDLLKLSRKFDCDTDKCAQGEQYRLVDLTLHLTAAKRVTGDSQSTTLMGASIEFDLMKLFVRQAAKQDGSGWQWAASSQILIGPAVAYDANLGKWCYGGVLAFKFNLPDSTKTDGQGTSPDTTKGKDK